MDKTIAMDTTQQAAKAPKIVVIGSFISSIFPNPQSAKPPQLMLIMFMIP
jgi:hypothetical protein